MKCSSANTTWDKITHTLPVHLVMEPEAVVHVTIGKMQTTISMQLPCIARTRHDLSQRERHTLFRYSRFEKSRERSLKIHRLICVASLRVVIYTWTDH